MSDIVSPAQVLPFHIICQVIRYTDTLAKDNWNGGKDRLTCKVMLSVCSSWRLAALDSIWCWPIISTGYKGDSICLEHPRWAKNFKPSISTAGFVKMLILGMPLKLILNGTAYKLLSEFMGDITNLPAANKLSIRIDDCIVKTEYSIASATDNVLEFAQLLKSLTPAKTMTEVICPIQIGELGKHEEECFGTLVNSLGNRSKNVTLSIANVGLTYPSTIDLIPQVSSLELCCKSPLDLHASLVHKCANKLLRLDLRICSAKTLFYDANDNIVVYPYLQSLTLSEASNDVSIERASVPNVATLPSLESLTMYLSYPYDDDVLFRGNSATLKCLDITIDQLTVNVLNRNGMFRNKYRNLGVVIRQNNNFNDLSLVSSTDMMRCIGSLASASQQLKIDNALLANYLKAETPPSRGFESLQVLHTNGQCLSLVGVLRMLRVLPNLLKITCVFGVLGAELENIATEELPDYIASTYCEVGKNLQVVSTFWYNGPISRTTPEYVLLLALVCPKLHRIKITPYHISDLKTSIAEALQTGPYSKYASQLNCLLHAVY